MHQLGELDPGTRCMGVLFFVPLRERGTRPRGRMARRGAAQPLAAEYPERERGRVKGSALARPNIVRYTVTIPKQLCMSRLGSLLL